MWLMNHFFAPGRPTWKSHDFIDACYKVALFEWLIRWAETVEHSYDDLYTGYPFNCHEGPEPVAVTLREARKTLIALMNEPDAGAILSMLDYEIAKLGNAALSWRGKPARTCWDSTSFHVLTDMTSYES